MKNLINRLIRFNFPEWTPPLAILGVCLMAYGLLIPWLGYYWDDWAFAWISQNLGDSGLRSYFATNRPVWGWLFRLSTPILGAEPWVWQVFALTWRWLSGVLVWQLVRLLWPRQKTAALWAALLFVLYPAFTQQHIAITYGHFFIVLDLFLLSLCLSILALRGARKKWVFTALALLTSAANLFMMEYFFMLELLRPLVLWLAAEDNRTDRLRRTLLRWLPYLTIFLAALIWRAFLFPYQNENYESVLLQQLKTSPFSALASLALAAGRDLFTVTLAAWSRPFWIPDVQALGRQTTLFWAGLVCLSLPPLAVYLVKQPGQDVEKRSATDWKSMLIFSGAALLLAGPPFWLTNLVPALSYPANRFTLPFMLGSVLLLTAFFVWLPLKPGRKALIIALLAAFSIGVHFQSANEYRRSWDTQNRFFWQLAWRMPALQPGTTLLTNDLPIQFCSDNSLTSPLNWMFSPNASGSRQMDYILYWPTVRLGKGLPGLVPGLPIRQDYLATSFEGSTSQIISIQYSPPACLRVLDPETEPENIMITELMRASARLTDTRWILPAPLGNPSRPPAGIFAPEPARNFCYYYQKADLARQQKDWQKVAELGDTAFALSDSSNDPMERLVFIEGYAHVGDWEKARALSLKAAEITPLMRPPLCRLWQRIARETAPDPARESALSEALAAFCQTSP